MKRNLSLILMCLLGSFLMAQNGAPKWAFPGVDPGNPSSVLFNVTPNSTTSLPIGNTTFGIPYDYLGQVPQRAFASQMDQNGDLLFFIVDEYLYDKDGIMLADFLHLTKSVAPTVNSSQFEDIHLGNDISIIPVPGECSDKYYIVFTSNADFTFNAGFYYYRIDFSQPSRWDPLGTGRLGRIDDYNFQTGFQYIGRPITYSTGTLPNLNTYRGGYSINFTKPKSNGGERFMYLSGGDNIERYRVTNTGFVDDNYSLNDFFNVVGFDIFAGDNGNGHFINSDIVQLSNGNYRLAVALHPGGPGSWPSSAIVSNSEVLIVDIDAQNGDFLSVKSASLPSNSLHTIKGLELSENGRYLYASSPTSPFLFYVDLNVSFPNNNYPFLSLSGANTKITSASAYQLGNIEKGDNGKLYFAKSNGLAFLDESNDPLSSWYPNQINFTNHLLVGKGYSIPEQLNNEPNNRQLNLSSTTISILSNVYCPGELAFAEYFSPHPDNLTGPVLWSNGDFATTTHFETGFGTTYVHFDATNEYGCTDRINGFYTAAGPDVNVTLSASSTEFCPLNGPLTISYSAVFNGPGSVAGFTWSKNGVHYSSNSTITADGIGEYCFQFNDAVTGCVSEPECIMITDPNCGVIDPSFTATKQIPFPGSPTYEILINAAEDRSCASHRWIVQEFINGVHTGGSPTVTLQGPSSSDGVLNYTFQSNPAYSYEIIHWVTSACRARQIVSVNSSSFLRRRAPQISEEIVKDKVIFPNPANNVLNIAEDLEYQRYSIQNTSGRDLFDGTARAIDLSSMQSGIYFISFFNEKNEKIITKKFIKQ